MLINPYTDALETIPGTRLLINDLGVTGATLVDPMNHERLWTVTALYAPIVERKLSGIRLKLIDQKNFTTFCNQRDFEVMAGLAKPGDWCRWAGALYVGVDDRDNWFGFCMDYADLHDDLYERELALRAEYPEQLPERSEIWRRLHLNETRDAEEFWILRWDLDPEIGLAPDPRIETLRNRWSCVSRDWFDWTRV
jgi:hypothetical protein